MDIKAIEMLLRSDRKIDVGKITKDGIDINYSIAVQKYDEFTGEAIEPQLYTLTVDELKNAIDRAEKHLKLLTDALAFLSGKEIPVFKAIVTPPPSLPEEKIVEEKGKRK